MGDIEQYCFLAKSYNKIAFEDIISRVKRGFYMTTYRMLASDLYD